MGYAKRHIGSADVMIDETTGALLVKIGDADLSVDVADVDVQAIVDGIAGSSPKTLAELETVLQSILTKLIAAPATEARQDAVAAALGLLALEDGGNLADLATKATARNDKLDSALATLALEDGGNLATAAGRLGEIEKDHKAGTRYPHVYGRAVGTPTERVALSDEPRPYLRAWLQGYTPGDVAAPSSSSSGSSSSSAQSSSSSSAAPTGDGDADNYPVVNTGNIYVFSRTEGLEEYAFVLGPGERVELPPNCDLADFYIDAAVQDEGVTVMYSCATESDTGSSSSSSSSA